VNRSSEGDVPVGELDRLFTFPNALSALRLGCLPLFVVLLRRPDRKGRAAAAWLLGALGVTDGLDGYVARRFDQVSSLGEVLDPLVDRALVLTATAGALRSGAVPRWLVGLVVARESVAAGGAAVLAIMGAERVRVSRVGKMGAFGMMVALPLFILGSSRSRWHRQAVALGWVFAAAGQACAWAAVAGYVPKALTAYRLRRANGERAKIVGS